MEYLAGINPAPTSSDLAERAYHHECARQFAPALRCYHEAGMQLHGQGAHNDALKLFSAAQRMLAKLRAAAGIAEDRLAWKLCTPQKMVEVFAGDAAMAVVALQSVLRLAQSLLIYLQSDGGVADKELAKLAHNNAVLMLEQALCMIKLATDGDGGLGLTLSDWQDLFWECYSSGPLKPPLAEPNVTARGRFTAWFLVSRFLHLLLRST